LNTKSLYVPVVLLGKELYPEAVFPPPEVLEPKELYPLAVLLFPNVDLKAIAYCCIIQKYYQT
jgi:hypothetical protein